MSPGNGEIGCYRIMSTIPIHDLIPRQIERLSMRRFEWLTFPPALEARYEQDISAYRLGRLWFEGMIAVCFFNLFLLANYFLLHTESLHDVVVRSCLVTPVALLVNLAMRMNPTRVYREASIAVATCWFCYTHLYLELSRPTMDPEYAQVGVIIAVLFANVVMRLQFPYALVASVAMMAGDMVFLQHIRMQSLAEKIFAATLTMCAVAMTVMANYSLGREARLAYMLRLRGELQSARLSVSNEELQRISNRDELTGLANRYAFSQQYSKLWKQALTSRIPLSAVVIDIDNFKAVNDLCGHLYGDQVLKRIALLVQQALRGKEDFAARFGGEEFVVLLPRTNPEIAVMVAERIRKLVEVAGSPALDEDAVPELPAVWATVSCGVSTCWPTHTDAQNDLLSAADKAMYKAKQGGRNRVCFGEMAIVAEYVHV